MRIIFCLYLIKHHALKGIYLQEFLTLALDGGEWSASGVSRFTSGRSRTGNRCVGGCVGPQNIVDSASKRKNTPYPQNLYCKVNTIRVTKSRRVRWAGHVERMGQTRNAYNFLVGIYERRTLLRWLRNRWENNFRMDLREIRCEVVGYFRTAQNMNWSGAAMNKVIKFRFYKRLEISWLDERQLVRQDGLSPGVSYIVALKTMANLPVIVPTNVGALSGRELYHLQFSLQAASPKTFGYNLVLP
jgi:hypothetical protein